MAGTAIRGRLSWRLADVVAHAPASTSAWRIALDRSGMEPWQPGQHVDLRLTAEDGYQAERSYSIASAPEAETLDLVVERLEDGEVSSYLTDVLRPGDRLELRGPIGGYFVWTASDGSPLQLIAGGSGIAPFLGMLDHHEAIGTATHARMLYSTRTRRTIIDAERLERHRGRGIDLTIAITREQPAGWTGLVGRVTPEVIERLTIPVDDAPIIFVCGPTVFVESVADALVRIGHAPDRIRTERFGGAEPDA